MFYLAEKIRYPQDLAEPLQQSLSRLGLLARAPRHLANLWPKLAKEHGLSERHYSFQRAEAEAYAAYYLPVNALKPALVLEEAWQLGADLFAHEEAIWLDCGSGPGTGFWGLSWWAQRRDKKIRYVGIEQSKAFTELASRVASGRRADFRLMDLSRRKDLLALIQDLRPTHVSFLNSLNEIYSDLSERKEVVADVLAKLRACTRVDGKKRYLLLLEPGTQAHSRGVSELKDFLGMQYRVHLPCIDNRACGALINPKDWCHEEVDCEFPEWLEELGSAAQLKKEAFIFSYALLSTDAPEASGVETWRMVSQRMERKGQVECFFCTKAGKARVRLQRSKAHSENEFFFGIRRGDILFDSVIGEKGDMERAERAQPFDSSIFSS